MSDNSPYQLDALLALLEPDTRPRIAHLHGHALHSHFQPIFSLAHRRVVGHEGLLRAWSAAGKMLSPYTVFAAAQSAVDLVTLDRLARLLHTANFVGQKREAGSPPVWLFLNAEPNAFADAGLWGPFFRDMLAHFDLPATSVVVEVLETAIENNRKLSRAVDYFRDLGCLIAIDDFGAGHSNVDRIWRLKPDIVKLDRTLIADAADSPEARQILPGLVNLLHEAGSLVLAEGIETQKEALLALEADCDLVQGFYFAIPAAKLIDDKAADDELSHLWQAFGVSLKGENRQSQSVLHNYVDTLLASAKRLADGLSFSVPAFEAAAQPFGSLPLAIRTFLLDSDGRQVADINGQHATESLRFLPLANTEGAIWSRRAYFRRALKRFGELQISRPYLSLTEAEVCVTLSVGLLLDGQAFVLCGDIERRGEEDTFDVNAG